jgi:hypothetical protein
MKFLSDWVTDNLTVAGFGDRDSHPVYCSCFGRGTREKAEEAITEMRFTLEKFMSIHIPVAPESASKHPQVS